MQWTRIYPLLLLSLTLGGLTHPVSVLAASAQDMSGVRFSDPPKPQEIFRSHVLPEPLVPAAGVPSVEENRALVRALLVYRQRIRRDDLSSLESFLRLHPQSPWKAAVALNLGVLYFKAGFLTQSMEVLREGWNASKSVTEPQGKRLADQVFSELMKMCSRLGRLETMDSLFREAGTREFEGPASVGVLSTRETLFMMKNHPLRTYKCGPTALLTLLRRSGDKLEHFDALANEPSTPKGMSLKQIAALSRRVGMKFRMARREPGAPLIVPAVLHWKQRHFSALVAQKGSAFHVVDPTFGEDLWVSREALDVEASGYFLVPEGELPRGWTPVDSEEAADIWGALGFVDNDKDGTSEGDAKVGGASGKGGSTPGGSGSASGDGSSDGRGDDSGDGGDGDGHGDDPDCGPTGMPVYTFHAMVASLNITDVPVGHTPPRGPSTRFRVTYNHREAWQPYSFTYSNLGPKWTFGWSAYIQDDATLPANSILLLPRGGGREIFTWADTTYTFTKAQEISQTRIRRMSYNPPVYERLFADGSKEIYSQSDGSTSNSRRVFLTRIIDMRGDTLRFTHDSLLRVTKAIDPLGQESVLAYELGADPYKITKVTDPFGRWAGFSYDSQGRLIRIRDVLGLESEFTYASSSSDFIIAMSTPYGTTRFSRVDDSEARYRSLEATDPMGRTERLEFRHDAPGIGAEPLAPTGMSTRNLDTALDNRNTFYWDKNAMLLHPGDYTKALNYHWTSYGQLESTSRIPSSIKPPLESRIWFNYPGQPNPEFVTFGIPALPSHVGRVLDDSSTQLYTYEYDTLGNVTKAVDPIGRTTHYTYAANGIDLISVRQQNGPATDLLDTITYNAQHLPLTVRDASGQTWTYTYNSRGQVLAITNPRGEPVSYTYDAAGYLVRITGSMAGDTTALIYDAQGRIRTTTDRDGYTVRREYDDMDRLTKVVFPDSTYQAFVYDKLDLSRSRDRRGRWTQYVYNAVRELTAVRDPLGRTTTLEWCGCGAMESLVDPEGRTTRWRRDVQGRVTEKEYADGRKLLYAYQNNTSRLRAVTDAKSQVKNFLYFKDGNLKSFNYGNAHISTPTVSYTYDSVYNRILSMSDGVGPTHYAYHPITSPATLGAGRLASIDGPWSNDSISFAYDSLGRTHATRINGVLDSVVYDSLGRITTAVNALGSFAYRYVGKTGRLDSLLLPNGQLSVYSYFNVAGDLRLKEIKHLNPALAQLSRFAYTYDPEGQIKTWTQQADSALSQVHHLAYDPADQLLADVVKSATSGAVLRQFAYAYDKAGNRVSVQEDSVLHSFTYNTLNQVTERQGGGHMRFRGRLNEPGTLTLNGAAAPQSADSTFDAQVQVTSGLDTVTVVAKDYADNTRTHRYQVSSTGSSAAYTYDLNGNMTGDGTRTYEWDAEDRLVAVNSGQFRSEFTYDGLGRRVRIVELDNGSATSQKNFLWVGDAMAEERDATGGAVAKRYFGQGVQVGAARFYYTRDHLGSVREMTDSLGAVAARYTYDPFGMRTKVGGSGEADFGFTGHYLHERSGLHLAKYRAYSSGLGRWLARDPIGEDDGPNIYAYVLNNPINDWDALGLAGKPGKNPLGRPDGGPWGGGCGGGGFGWGMGRGGGGGGGFGRGGGNGNGAGGKSNAGPSTSQAPKSNPSPPEATKNRSENNSKGIPDTQLGPSGKPKVHIVDHSSKKEAKEAAEKESKGQPPLHHPNPSKGQPHFHPTDGSGEKKTPNVHHNYPK